MDVHKTIRERRFKSARDKKVYSLHARLFDIVTDILKKPTKAYMSITKGLKVIEEKSMLRQS